jgi:2-C-methyl-D-erythritol 4-phosphate cytidylyltransferase
MALFEYPISVILLAGGLGIRMQAPLPKQFLRLAEKPIARYSFEVFMAMPEVFEIIIVCDPAYHSLFQTERQDLLLTFAAPGARRQDSVFNGFKKANPKAHLICIHDSARPFISSELVRPVLAAAHEMGAAALGMPVKFTVKECDGQGFVNKTPARDGLWEIQTPQVIRPNLLQEGCNKANHSKLTVTDDVSLVELISHPVKIVRGCYENIKITTPDDLWLAKNIVRKYNG